MNKVIKMGHLRSTLLLAAVMLLSQGCRKNEAYIAQQIIPLDLGIRLTVDDVEVETNAFGAICSDENSELVLISNNPSLLAGDLSPADMESGDFILIKETTDGNTNYTLLYIYEYENGGITEFILLIDELTEVDNFEIGDNYAEGSHSGSFQNDDESLLFDYNVAFITELTSDPELCQ